MSAVPGRHSQPQSGSVRGRHRGRLRRRRNAHVAPIHVCGFLSVPDVFRGLPCPHGGLGQRCHVGTRRSSLAGGAGRLGSGETSESGAQLFQSLADVRQLLKALGATHCLEVRQRLDRGLPHRQNPPAGSLHDVCIVRAGVLSPRHETAIDRTGLPLDTRHTMQKTCRTVVRGTNMVVRTSILNIASLLTPHGPSGRIAPESLDNCSRQRFWEMSK